MLPYDLRHRLPRAQSPIPALHRRELPLHIRRIVAHFGAQRGMEGDVAQIRGAAFVADQPLSPFEMGVEDLEH